MQHATLIADKLQSETPKAICTGLTTNFDEIRHVIQGGPKSKQLPNYQKNCVKSY